MLALIIWFGLPLALVIIGFWGIWQVNWDDNIQSLAAIMLTFGIAILVSVIIVLPVHRYEVVLDCQKFKTAKEFCETKTYMTETERFALAQKAVEQNQWLAKAQYCRRNPLLSIFWPEEVDTLEMIK
jgi:Cu/Ag efflux pump CusA